MRLSTHIRALLCALFFIFLPLFAPAAQSSLEISVYSASTDEEIETVAAEVKHDLQNAQAENPSLKPEIIIEDQSQEQLDASSAKKKRIAMALVRGAISGAAATWSLTYKSDVPLSSVLPVAAALGLFSGTTQYHFEILANFLNRSPSKLGKFLKWWGIEVGFITLAKAGTLIAGISHNSFQDALTSTMITSVVSTATQGIWDVAVTEHRKLMLSINPSSHAPRIRLINDLKILGISAASIALNLALMRDVPGSVAALTAMGLSGLVQYGLVLQQKSRCNAALKRQRIENGPG